MDQSVKYKILIVDDDEMILRALRHALFSIGTEILEARSAEEALDMVADKSVDLVISDYHFGNAMTGIDLFEKISSQHPEIMNILLTGKPDLNMAMDAINRAMIYKVMLKPWDNSILCLSVRRALEKVELSRENKRLTSELKKRDDIIEDLESKNPGITDLKRDESGFIVIEDE